MALHSAKMAYQTVEVSLRDKPAALLALSPKGTVPVLHLQDGTVLVQSLDIMRWALRQNDPQGWLTAADASEMNHWIELCDSTFKPLLDRYKYANRHPELTMAEHRTAAVTAFVLPLENMLQAKRNAASGHATASLADVAMFPFVRQFAAVDPAWFDAQPLPAVQVWLAAWLGSDLWKSCMAKVDSKLV
jgi:glutathione S-transferase